MSDLYKALADPTRRDLLDRLFMKGGQTLGDLSEGAAMSRQAVTKHLRILEEANLVSVKWLGRNKLHYLNPVPLTEIVHRWVGKFEDARLEALADFKEAVEAKEREKKHG
ncbi:ArsR/SmtB family transcription factor [Paracoccaceae bacterium GXU_MW_L88]